MSDGEAAIRERLEFGLRTKLPAELGAKWKQALHDLDALEAELAAARASREKWKGRAQSHRERIKQLEEALSYHSTSGKDLLDL